MDWDIGTDTWIFLIPCPAEMADEILLYSAGLHSGLCADLNGEEIQEGGDLCVRAADSLCCTVEINTTL